MQVFLKILRSSRSRGTREAESHHKSRSRCTSAAFLAPRPVLTSEIYFTFWDLMEWHNISLGVFFLLLQPVCVCVCSHGCWPRLDGKVMLTGILTQTFGLIDRESAHTQTHHISLDRQSVVMEGPRIQQFYSKYTVYILIHILILL